MPAPPPLGSILCSLIVGHAKAPLTSKVLDKSHVDSAMVTLSHTGSEKPVKDSIPGSDLHVALTRIEKPAEAAEHAKVYMVHSHGLVGFVMVAC